MAPSNPAPPSEEDSSQREGGDPGGVDPLAFNPALEEDYSKKEAAPPGGLTPPTPQPYDPAADREAARSYIAKLLIYLLIGIVVASFFSLWIGVFEFERIKPLLELVFTPIVALVGSATGFYFGSNTKS